MSSVSISIDSCFHWPKDCFHSLRGNFKVRTKQNSSKANFELDFPHFIAYHTYVHTHIPTYTHPHTHTCAGNVCATATLSRFGIVAFGFAVDFSHFAGQFACDLQLNKS